MSDLRDEIFSGDFPEYRQREIEIAASFVSIASIQREGNDYIRGALDMFRKILNIPVEFAKTNEQKEIIGKMVDRDFAIFEIEYLRKAVRNES